MEGDGLTALSLSLLFKENMRSELIDINKNNDYTSIDAEGREVKTLYWIFRLQSVKPIKRIKRIGIGCAERKAITLALPIATLG